MDKEKLKEILVDLYNAESGTELNEEQAVYNAFVEILELEESSAIKADEITLQFFRKYLKMPKGNLEEMCKEIEKLNSIIEGMPVCSKCVDSAIKDITELKIELEDLKKLLNWDEKEQIIARAKGLCSPYDYQKSVLRAKDKEIDELKKENMRLKVHCPTCKILSKIQAECNKYKDEIEKQVVEIEQVEFERDRYREALEKIAKNGCGFCSCSFIAKFALEQTVMHPIQKWEAKCYACEKIFQIEIGTRFYKCSCGKWCFINGSGKSRKEKCPECKNIKGNQCTLPPRDICDVWANSNDRSNITVEEWRRCECYMT